MSPGDSEGKSPTLTNLVTQLLAGLKGQNPTDEENEYLSKSEKRLKRMKKLFIKGSFVPLGLLVKESDPNYRSKAPTTMVKLTDHQTLKAKDKYVDPSSWSEFSLLFVRLIRGYITVGSYMARADALFDYLERLSLHHQVATCSDQALIAYDKRVRSRSLVPFDWLVFDQEVFEIVKAEFKSTASMPSGARKNLFGGSTKPMDRSVRTKHGQCNGWLSGNGCKFSKFPEGCRFAHWCINPKCVKSDKTNHKPSVCPNSGKKPEQGVEKKGD